MKFVPNCTTCALLQFHAPFSISSRCLVPLQLERLLRTQEAELRKRENEVERLQDENRSLKQENREMHRFLADYGLHWVGGSATSTPRGSVSAASSVTPSPPPTGSAGAEQRRNRFAKPAPSLAQPPRDTGAAPQQKASTSNYIAPRAMGGADKAAASTDSSTTLQGLDTSGALPDMERVRRAVAELNAMADGDAGAIVKRRDGSHGFATPSLTLTFWSNGLQLNDGTLRPYGASEAIAFLRDLLDGFFPYELKHAFPEGVIFDLSDQSNHAFGTPGGGGEHQWGCGRQLDSRGDHRVSRITPSAASLVGTTAGALSSLASAASPPLTSTGAAASVAHSNGGSRLGGSDGCKLQIKGVGGGIACVLDLPPSTQLSVVHAALVSRAAVPTGAAYELWTAFPAKPLNDPQSTLAALGLVPSATLLVRITSLDGAGKAHATAA